MTPPWPHLSSELNLSDGSQLSFRLDAPLTWRPPLDSQQVRNTVFD
jgi:hypothetical protein